ncbi:MAG: diaminopimelate epimerase [Actinomycetota bacterium]
MDEIPFGKYNGTGNDFVMIADVDGRYTLSPQLIAAICDRHRGVGADGLIRVTESSEGDFFMDYSNADGNVSQMCGNGIRCLSKLVYERGLTDKRDLAIETRAGLKYVSLHLDDGVVNAVTVDMGAPALNRGSLPMEGDPASSFLAEPVEVEGHSYKGSAVSMGNPHLVLFVDTDPRDVDVAGIGSRLERDPRFPEGTNVEFAAPAAGGLAVRVWERGVGETMACGTGACASLVAAHLAGLVPARADVTFPGGTLDVDWRRDQGDHVFMTGSVERTFEGVLEPAWLEAGLAG